MASMGTDNILDSAKRMRTPPQQQRSQNQVHPPPSTSRHPPLASIQAGHVQFHPSSSSGVQTQTQAPQDTSGTRVGNIPHANVSQGSNVPPSSSIGSLLRHYPPSSFQPNNYPGQYTLSQQPPPFTTAHPSTYPYTHARGYVPHFPLESGPYHQNLPGFGSMMQARSPYHTGGLPYTLGGNSGMHSTASSPTAHSPLPVQPPPPGTSGSHSILQYQPVRYPSPYTPYRYNHAYQPNPYQWHYNSPVPPGFNEGIPMHYQPQYQINFPHSQDSPSSDLETHFSQVSIRGSPTSPVQSTASSAVLPARHPPQVALTAPPSSSVSNSPKIFARTEGHASPSRLPKVNSPSCSHSERPAVRRPHHPNPPSHKSEWVMWIGNVPGGTTHDELWRFLKRPPVDDDSFESEDNGISSIFLISRSNCAFVNFDTEEHLRRAIVQFNGQHLHPHERRGPRLVCRVRRKEDDLRAGVGGQRGVGMHTRYIREQSQQGQMDNQVTPSEDDRSSSTGRRSSLSSESGNPLAVAAPQSSDEEAARAHQGSQPGDSVKAQSNSSYASTNSSFLSRHFPKRFFILKSLTQFDLDLSVENGLWATQKHNEAILDQAYRTSSDVILIFSVNKSGEFYGYAHMAGRILKGEHRVSWASHADPSATSVSSSRRAGSPSPHIATDHSFFTPSENRLVEESPMPFTPHSGGILSSKPSPMEPHRSSAPAALGPCPPREESSARKLNLRESRKAMTVTGLISRDFVNVTPEIVLDKNAPVRALRNQESTDGAKSAISALQPVEEENNSIGSDDGNTGEEQQKDDVMPSMAKNAGNDEQQAWGQPFKVEWLCTERLPFYSTRHLRNPWNQDREIKVSRDGTEVEPGVGQQLLEQWRTLAAAPVVMETSKSPAAVDRRAAKPTSTLPPAAVNSRNSGQSS